MCRQRRLVDSLIRDQVEDLAIVFRINFLRGTNGEAGCRMQVAGWSIGLAGLGFVFRIIFYKGNECLPGSEFVFGIIFFRGNETVASWLWVVVRFSFSFFSRNEYGGL